MILKSFLVEKNIKLLDQYFATLVYGENIGMKDDIKNQISFIKITNINFNQDEIIKNGKILDEHIYTHLYLVKKLYLLMKFQISSKTLFLLLVKILIQI